MTLPNFLIIGAAKSGTTSLHYYLGQHPEIFMCPKKDTFFFDFYVPGYGSFQKSGLTTVTDMGSNALSPGGQGTLVLVAPIRIQSSLAVATHFAVFGTLTLSFVPEPGTLLLYGWAALVLAVYSRRKSRR